ncbi:MAG: hypothetical protein A2345_12305 [Sulfurimonas sp. RIFOXYB12_FULL_35_9]|nr:MAG: hypothetical protein A2345_12305 [Sulfurimonas sp. RIFOXYB12_FULL_35_9]
MFAFLFFAIFVFIAIFFAKVYITYHSLESGLYPLYDINGAKMTITIQNKPIQATTNFFSQMHLKVADKVR